MLAHATVGLLYPLAAGRLLWFALLFVPGNLLIGYETRSSSSSSGSTRSMMADRGQCSRRGPQRHFGNEQTADLLRRCVPDKTEKLTEGGEAAEVWHALQDTGDARTPRTGLPVSLKFVDDKLTTIGQ